MLPVESVGRLARLAPVRDRRPREVQRPPRRVGHHLDPRGIAGELRIERRRGGADVVARLAPASMAPASASADRKGSSPCTLATTSNPANSGRRGRLGHPVGAGEVPVVGQHRAHAGPLHHLGDHGRVGRDHQLVA